MVPRTWLTSIYFRCLKQVWSCKGLVVHIFWRNSVLLLASYTWIMFSQPYKSFWKLAAVSFSCYFMVASYAEACYLYFRSANTPTLVQHTCWTFADELAQSWTRRSSPVYLGWLRCLVQVASPSSALLKVCDIFQLGIWYQHGSHSTFWVGSFVSHPSQFILALMHVDYLFEACSSIKIKKLSPHLILNTYISSALLRCWVVRSLYVEPQRTDTE